ncbi:MAG TPA: hypothetical protein VFJ30_11720 [Phycisphaerae bacterium]|nr:hypothetical protein [Phycisphaerae bacterium]
MGYAIPGKYLEVAAYVLLTLVLAAAIFFWGRGIRRSRRSDLVAGPAILAVLCAILLAINSSSAVFGMIGELVLVFGFATILLSAMAGRGSLLARRDVLAIGVGCIILGICLCTIV